MCNNIKHRLTGWPDNSKCYNVMKYLQICHFPLQKASPTLVKRSPPKMIALKLKLKGLNCNQDNPLISPEFPINMEVISVTLLLLKRYYKIHIIITDIYYLLNTYYWYILHIEYHGDHQESQGWFKTYMWWLYVYQEEREQDNNPLGMLPKSVQNLQRITHQWLTGKQKIPPLDTHLNIIRNY